MFEKIHQKFVELESEIIGLKKTASLNERRCFDLQELVKIHSDEAIPLKEFCSTFNVSRRSVYNFIDSGLPTFKTPSGRRMFKLSECKIWLRDKNKF